MKKYTFSRKIQLKNYIKSANNYESAEFLVEGADSKKEAVEEVRQWMREYVKVASEVPEEPFADDECVSTAKREQIAKEVENKLNNKWDKEHPTKESK